MSLNIIARAEWGARRRKSAPDTVAAKDRQAFMVHYSTGEELGREDTAEWVREIQAYHMDSNGWQDIGYNFLVDREGRIFEGRGWDAIGAHCKDFNTSRLGVCFLGDDDPGTDVPEAAWSSIFALFDEAENRAGHRLEREGHRDHFATACPGDELYERWAEGRRPQGAAPAGPRVPSTTRPLPQKQPSTIAPDFPLRGDRVLAKGSTGRYVGQIQKQLQRRGWRIDVDSIFGPQTERVVRAFQKEKGLKVDGLVGPKTWRAAWLAPLKGRFVA